MTRARLLAAPLLSLVLAAAVGAPAFAADKTTPAKKAAASKAASKQAAPDKAAKTSPKAAKVSGPCYSPAEFDAEQAIRYHTRLMVIGLTCQQLGGNYEGLYVRYKKFTLAHKTQIIAWEDALIARYRKTAKGNPNRALDTLRTHLANEMSQHIAAVSTDIYCAQHADMLAQAELMNDADVVKTVTNDAVVRVSELPRCDLPPPVMAAATASDRITGPTPAVATPTAAAAKDAAGAASGASH
ncbi:hypothetical protein UAJ10_19005 [Nitrospirillum sp. BR 11164]|uniref:hypothetical protein n=1 Tax=Nitrospirillum sp. BR 11164 TaxID=3104324 RepID=UPI002AFF51D6|nr:hypothetical protein [Nitrospirillum sp. BR 11164]MEA1651100.1 hypothetical protein [Nitrospirillum sp. BR 11164]